VKQKKNKFCESLKEFGKIYWQF